MSAPTSDPAGLLLPPARGVALRLYRQGLGDSFLLAFPRADGGASGPFYLLIDCGVILGTPEPRGLMEAVVHDIAAATGGRIDLLVITHEHWDHVSGFLQAEDAWKSSPIRIESVWMAWTEDMSISLAKRLKEDFQNDLDALRLALDRAGPDARHLTALTGLLGLFGDPHALMAAAKSKRRFSKLTHDAMKKVRELAGDRVEYRKPGEALALPGVTGVRIHVLGPPQNERVLRNIRPSKRKPQTYTHAPGTAPRPRRRAGNQPTEKAAFTLALRCRAEPGSLLRPLTDEEREVFGRCFPFDRRLQVPLKEAAHDDFFRAYYGFAEEAQASPPPPAPVAVPPMPIAAPPLPAPPAGPPWRRLVNGVDWMTAAAPKHDRKKSGGKAGGGRQASRRKKSDDERRTSPPTTEAAPAPTPTSGTVPTVSPEPPPESRFPFDRFLRVSLDEAARMPFFWEHYGFDGVSPPVMPTPSPLAAHPGPLPMGPDWRRVDTDWLGVASEMALQMDSYTNNTSLAMAIELLGTGKVLLFPADAQVGNWLSWDGIEPKLSGADGRPVAAADLLRRTVFYKVGHHGSHNATLREAGLERMTSPELIAFVPVDERVAHEVKNWNDMPFEPLLERLYEKTEGRVIRLDHGVVTDVRPEYLPEETWERIAPRARAFRDGRVRPGGRLQHPDGGDHPLYFELVIEDAP